MQWDGWQVFRLAPVRMRVVPDTTSRWLRQYQIGIWREHRLFLRWSLWRENSSQGALLILLSIRYLVVAIYHLIAAFKLFLALYQRLTWHFICLDLSRETLTESLSLNASCNLIGGNQSSQYGVSMASLGSDGVYEIKIANQLSGAHKDMNELTDLVNLAEIPTQLNSYHQ